MPFGYIEGPILNFATGHTIASVRSLSNFEGETRKGYFLSVYR